MKAVIRVLLLICLYLKAYLACDGYKLTILGFRNCGDENQIVKISSNSTMSLNGNCEIFSSVCADASPYKSAISMVVIKDDTITVLNYTTDSCNFSKRSNQLAYVLKAGSGLKCDGGIEKSYCDKNRKIIKMTDFSRKFLGLISKGNLTIRNTIKHDVGTSCIEGSIKLKRKRN